MDLNNPVFVHELIRLVKEQKSLYAAKDPEYRDQRNKIKAWREIAEKLNVPETKCKSKWKALRDQYVRETKRLRSIGSDGARWKYYNYLKFLSNSLFPARGPLRGSTKVEIKKSEDEELRQFDFSDNLTCDTNPVLECSSIDEENSNQDEKTQKNSQLLVGIEDTINDDPFRGAHHEMTTEDNDELNDGIKNPLTNEKEDEIDTFFKSIAMKVKSANFQTVDLIDLQIEILQVISRKLRIATQGNIVTNIQYSN